MKKTLSILLALTMLLAVCVPAFATQDITTSPGKVTVTTLTTVDGGDSASNWTVTIPANINLPWKTTEADLSYTVKAQLEPSKKISVNVTGNGALTKLGDSVNKIAYTLEGTTAFNDGPFLDGSTQTALKLKVTNADVFNTIPLDAYSDTITYAITVA